MELFLPGTKGVNRFGLEPTPLDKWDYLRLVLAIMLPIFIYAVPLLIDPSL